MTIDVAHIVIDEPILASDMLQVVKNVNGSPGRQLITASGTFIVPEGVHKFKVTLSGGGGGGGAGYETGGGEGGDPAQSAPGGNAPMISATFASDPGTTFVVTVGTGGAAGHLTTRGGTGGTTSFGPSFSSTGGVGSITGDTVRGSPGTATFPSGQPHIYHNNELICITYEDNELVGYGRGGKGGFGFFDDGNVGLSGVVLVEW